MAAVLVLAAFGGLFYIAWSAVCEAEARRAKNADIGVAGVGYFASGSGECGSGDFGGGGGGGDGGGG